MFNKHCAYVQYVRTSQIYFANRAHGNRKLLLTVAVDSSIAQLAMQLAMQNGSLEWFYENGLAGASLLAG